MTMMEKNLLNATDMLLRREVENGYGDNEKMINTWAEVCSYMVNGTYPLLSKLVLFYFNSFFNGFTWMETCLNALMICESKGD